MSIRTVVFLTLIAMLAVLSNVAARSHLEGRVTYTEGDIPNHYMRSEQHLQQAYDALNNYLEEDGKRKLGIAQSAWKRYKTAECDFEVASSAIRPLHPESYTECLTVMNMERARDLEYEIQWHQMLDPSFSRNEG